MNKKVFRKVHRYLGLFIGIQFIFWTISGLYFSWTNLDEIHGDHLKVLDYESGYYMDLFPLSDLPLPEGIQKLELRDIDGSPFYWINNSKLYSAETGKIKHGISESEAEKIARNNVIPTLEAKEVELITEVGSHDEYRGKPLPAYVISYDDQNKVKAYVSQRDGKFQTLRHRSWRWFDFLWMTHIMDYEGRDNFNTFLLRAFSLFGLVTVISGFTVWIVTSPSKPK